VKSRAIPTGVSQLDLASEDLVLPPVRDLDMAVILGKRGRGKSTVTKRLLRREAIRRRILFGDPHDEYSSCGRKTDNVDLGPLPQRMAVEDLVEHPELLGDPRLTMAAVMRGDPDGAAADFRHLVDLAETWGNLLLGFDEIGIYRELVTKEVRYVATQSRHWADGGGHGGVPLVLTTQRGVDVHPGARSQVSILVSFQQSHPEDLEALWDITLSDEFVDAVARLDVGRCCVWRDSNPTTRRKPTP
jgi:hypothetical protein